MNENDGSIVIEITGDDSGLEHALTDAEQRTREISSRAAQTAQQASQAAQTAAGAAANAASSMAQISSAADNAAGSVSGAASAISSAGTAASTAAGQINNVSSAVSAVNASAGSAASAMGDVSGAAQSAADAMSAVSSAASSAGASVGGTASETSSASAAAVDYTAALNGLQSALTSCSDSLTGIDSRLSEMSSGVRDTGDSADNADGILQKLGSTIKGVFTVALIKEFAGAVADVGKEFEYSLDKVSSIADTTVMSVGEISGGILDLSSEMGVHAADLNEAMYQAISAGVDTADAIDMVETAVKSAKAGFTDTTTAVDGLTTVLNAYKTANLDANDVANKFLITQNLGKTSFGELASTIGNIAPTANAAGVNIEELLSGVASLTANGIATSQAMTGMKAALSNIITPSSNAAKTAAELGIEFNAAALKSKGLGGFLDDLAEKTGGDTEVMAQLFGSVEALNTVLTLTSEGGAELFSKTMSEMETNTTALDSAYDTMTDNLTSNLDVMKTAAENFGIEIYNSVSGGLQDVVQSATEYIKRLRDAFTNGGLEGLAGELFQIAFDAVSELGNGIAEALPELVPQAVGIAATVAETILENVDTVADTAVDIIESLAESLVSPSTLQLLEDKAPVIIADLLTALGDLLSDVFDFGIEIGAQIVAGLASFDFESAMSTVYSMLYDVGVHMHQSVIDGYNSKTREENADFIGQLSELTENELKHLQVDLTDEMTSILQAKDDYVNSSYSTLDDYLKDNYNTENGKILLGLKNLAAEQGIEGTQVLTFIDEKVNELETKRELITDALTSGDYKKVPSGQNVYGGIMDNWDGVSETMSKVPGEFDEVAKSSANASAALEDSGKTAGKVSEKFKEYYDDLEFKLAHGDITEDEFKKRLSDKLNSDEQYATAAYTSYWNKVKDTSKKSSSDAKEKVSDDFKSFIDEQDRLKALGEKNGGISEETYWENVGKKLNETPDSKSNSAYSKYWTDYNKWVGNKEKREKENFDNFKASLKLREQTDDNFTEEDYYNALKEALESDEYKDNTLLASDRDAVSKWFEQADKRKAQEYKKWAAGLENKKQTDDNFSEEDYYKALREKLYSDEYVNNTELNSERDKVDKWFEQADKRKADDVKNQIAALDNLKNNTDMSEEEYYRKLEEIVFADDVKENQYLESFRTKVNNYKQKQQTEADKETLKNQQKAAKEELSQLKSDITEITNEYKKKIAEVTKARDKFESKLNENIFSTKEETITDARTGQTKKVKTDTVADIQKKINSRKKLAEKLKSLVEKNIPDGLLQELAGMDPDEALRFAEQLDKMGENEWNKIVDSYNEYTDINKKIADDIYGPQIESLNDEFKEKLGTALDGVTGDAARKGAELISEFVSGVDSASDDAVESIKKFGDNIISQLNSAVSDAKLEDGKMTFTLDIGSDIAESITDDKDALTDAGGTAAQNIADGIADKSSVITDAVISAIEAAQPDLEIAVNTKTSKTAESAAASAPAYDTSPESSGSADNNRNMKIPDITIDNVKLVWRDGKQLAEIVNSENKKLHVRGGKSS